MSNKETSTSAFDPDTFMQTEVEGKMETDMTPVPEGDYEAYIDDVTGAVVNTANGQQPVMHLTYVINDDVLLTEMGVNQLQVRQTLWLDFEADGVSLSFAKNKNLNLGRVREAVGQNTEGEPWAPAMLRGAGPLLIKVTHRYNAETGEGPYANVKRVTAA